MIFLNQMIYSVGRSTLCDIVKSTKKWVENEKSYGTHDTQAKHREFEGVLLILVFQVNAAHFNITYEIIKYNPKIFFPDKKGDFKFSSSWSQILKRDIL